MQPNKTDHYSILNVPRNATESEIIEARRRLARQYHPDKTKGDKRCEEIMKAINDAVDVLLNKEKRNEYDLNCDQFDDSISTLAGFNARTNRKRVHVGPVWSDGLRESLDSWKRAPKIGTHILRHPNRDGSCRVHRHDIPTIIDEYNSQYMTESAVERMLGEVLPKKIWEWSFSKIRISLQELFNSPVWQTELPAEKSLEPIQINCRLEDRELKKVMSFRLSIFTWPDIRELSAAILDFQMELSKYSHYKGARIPLCPDTDEMRMTLGIIPHHVVKKKNVVPQTDAANCTDCKSSFGFFSWKNHCASCGKAHCNDCMQVQKISDIADPVKICDCCKKADKEIYVADWLAPLDSAYARKSITPHYIAFIGASALATKSQFLEWSDLFFNEGIYTLAFQCAIAGGGDLFSLSARLYQKREISLAFQCINMTIRTTMDYIKAGDALATLNRELALYCYHQAKMSGKGYMAKAYKFIDYPIAHNCLYYASINGCSGELELEPYFDEALKKNDIGLALTCIGHAKITLSSWIKTIDSLDLSLVEPFMKKFSTQFDINLVKFKSDRDHFRWQYLGKPDCKVWLDYLVELLDRGASTDCILYFRSKMKDEDFIAHRDHFAASGEYTKMLICHCLANTQESWEDLALHFKTINENACIAAYMCTPHDLEKLGESFLKDSHVSLGLRCYMQAGNDLKIAELALKGLPNTRLLLLVQLWKKDPWNLENTFNLCNEMKVNAKYVKPLQNIIRAYLAGIEKKNRLPFYKFLIETGISDKELLGVLEKMSRLIHPDRYLNLYSDFLWEKRTELQERFRVRLHKAVTQYSLKEILSLSELMHPMTLHAVKSVLEEFKADEIEHSPLKSVCMVIQALSRLVEPTWNSLLLAMNDVTEALLGDPSEDAMEYYSEIVDRISRHTDGERRLKLCGDGMDSIEVSGKSDFTERLMRTPNLKVLIMHENAVKELEPLEAAFSFVDLCMGVPSAASMSGGFLNAALELLKLAERIDVSSNDAYAYRKGIFQLVTTAYTISHTHLNPATRLYVLRASIAILTKTIREEENSSCMIKNVSKDEIMIIDKFYKEAQYLVEFAPLVMTRMLQNFDLIYLDHVYSQFMGRFLESHRQTSSNPIYQYHILEGTIGWMGQEKFDFETERVKTMDALLNDKGRTIEEVEETMSWPGTVRDEDGWLPNKFLPINLSGKNQYHKVHGIRFDLNTGEMSLLLKEAETAEEVLFDENDVSDILQSGVTSAFFSLDEIDPNMPYNPLQKMRYGPESLHGTNYLATMMRTDIDMKGISMGVEVSARAPFAMRDAKNSLYKRLPKDLRKKFKELSSRDQLPSTPGKVHRFWIEAQEITYYTDIDGGKITYFLSDCEMQVKKQLMRRDKDNNLVDDETDDDKNSREAKFSKLMTEEYDRLGPEFLRLKELIKLQALSLIVQSTSHCSIPEEKIRKYLDKIKPTGNYRLTDQLITSIAENLQEKYHVSVGLRWHVEFWLVHEEDEKLVSQLKYSYDLSQKNQVERICKTFEKYGIATTQAKIDLDDSNDDPWVPAAYKFDDNRRIYGGVSMHTNLTSGGNIARGGGGGGISFPGKGQSGIGTQPYYVEGIDRMGNAFGKVIGVSISGNTYRTIDVGKTIRDQYNGVKANDTSAVWKTHIYPGQGNMHRSSVHNNGSGDYHHRHHTGGPSSCTNPKGQTSYYKDGDKSHRHK